MRILHVVHGLERGGLENGVINLANSLEAPRFTQAICCLDRSGPLAQRLARPQAISELNRSNKGAHLAARVRRVIRAWNPDVIHCRNWNAWPDTFVAALLTGKRRGLIWSVHGYHTAIDNWPALRLQAAKLLARYTWNLLTISQHTAEAYARAFAIPRERFTVVNNGVDCERFFPSRDKRSQRQKLGFPLDAFISVTVASLTPIKNHLALIRAAALDRDRSNSHYYIIGDGKLRPVIEAEVGRLGLTDRVHLLGHSDRVPEYLRAADVFVLPSKLEGMSNAILEAMASGLPVIANRVGGNPEILKDTTHGILIKSCTPQTLFAACTRLREQPALRAAMGSAARHHVATRYSLSSMVEQYAMYYSKVFDNQAA